MRSKKKKENIRYFVRPGSLLLFLPSSPMRLPQLFFSFFPPRFFSLFSLSSRKANRAHSVSLSLVIQRREQSRGREEGGRNRSVSGKRGLASEEAGGNRARRALWKRGRVYFLRNALVV